MKIIIQDFNYKGYHIDEYVSEMPQVKNLDEVPEGKIEEYIKENLDMIIK